MLKNEGPLAFYKGFWPLFQRKVTWTVIFFTAYEQLRSAANHCDATSPALPGCAAAAQTAVA